MAESLQSNIEDLQEDVVRCLEDIISLFKRANESLSSGGSQLSYTEPQKAVANEAGKVRRLELVMAIVAPMKAGKSTIINAIVGRDLLPSRNAAMTTIPTEIILDADLAEPTLSIDESNLSLFEGCVAALRAKVHSTRDMSAALKKIAQYPHLVPLLRSISAAPSVTQLRSRSSGRESIIQALTYLNDVARLCTLLTPDYAPLQQMSKVPRLATPFWRSEKTVRSDAMGNLVLVDTPGPNEATSNLGLEAIVADQLKRSSMVLIVLDFTQLKSAAAEKVKEDVQRIIDLRGKDNLYVLVNKIDQRRDNDMTSDEIHRFVAAEMGLGSDLEGHIFEVSAIRAFTYADFVQELKRHPSTPLNELKAACVIAKEMFPVNWKEMLDTLTKERFSVLAEVFWEQSQFAPFLDTAVGTLMACVAPEVMKTALLISLGHLNALRDDALLRSKAIDEDVIRIQKEIETLGNDLKSLLDRRSQLSKNAEQQQNKLREEIGNTLKKLGKKAKMDLDDTYAKLGKPELKQASRNPIVNFFRQFTPSGTRTEVEFKTEEEAEEFADAANNLANGQVERLMELARVVAERQINEARDELIKILKRETLPIIEQARNRLSDTFQVDLSFPWFDINEYTSGDTTPLSLSHQVKTRSVDQGYETIYRRRWYTLFLWRSEIKVKRPALKETFYTFSVRELVDLVNGSIDESLRAVEGGIEKYLADDFDQRIDVFFTDLNEYLRGYQSSLEQAQSDKLLSDDKLRDLSNKLKTRVPEIEVLIKCVCDLLERAEKALSQAKAKPVGAARVAEIIS